MRTNFPQKSEDLAKSRTVSAQETPDSSDENVKWPKRLKHRNKVLVTVYRKTKR